MSSPWISLTGTPKYTASAWERQIMASLQTLSSQTNHQILARLLQVLNQTQPKPVESEIQRTLAIFVHGLNFTTVNRILTTDGLMIRGRSNESVLLYSQVTTKFWNLTEKKVWFQAYQQGNTHCKTASSWWLNTYPKKDGGISDC